MNPTITFAAVLTGLCSVPRGVFVFHFQLNSPSSTLTILKPSCKLRVSMHVHIWRAYCEFTFCLLADNIPV